MKTDLRTDDQPCIACEGTTVRDIYRVNGVQIARCECGLSRAQVPQGFDPSSIYTEEYFKGGHSDGYADYAGSADALRREFRPLAEALARRTGGGRLIEIGSAYGFFLDVALQHFDAHGVEISDTARAACTQRGLDVSRTIAEAVEGQPPFDAAVMLDVIEHLPHPAQVLDQLRAAMRPGAPLVLTTGDQASLLARLMGRHWRLMTPPQHLYFFTPESIAALLARHGFDIERVEHPSKRVPLSLIAYQACRYLGPRAQAWVRRRTIRGAVPVNLLDTMRITATAATRTVSEA